MTSSVKSTACCGADKELVITRSDGQETVIQDGEHYETHVYDDLVVNVTERVKVTVTTDSEVGGDGPHK